MNISTYLVVILFQFFFSFLVFHITQQRLLRKAYTSLVVNITIREVDPLSLLNIETLNGMLEILTNPEMVTVRSHQVH